MCVNFKRLSHDGERMDKPLLFVPLHNHNLRMWNGSQARSSPKGTFKGGIFGKGHTHLNKLVLLDVSCV